MKDFVLCLLFHTSLSDISSHEVNLLIVLAGWFLAKTDASLAVPTAADCTLYFFHILPTSVFHTRQGCFFHKAFLLNGINIFISMAA